MRRQTMVLLAVLLTLGVQPAAAQFALSPRGIFGLMTRPLREMLGPLRGLRHYDHHRSVRERSAKLSEPSQAKLNASEAAAGPQQDMAGLNAYDNVLGYAFWPSDYAGEFDRYGFGDIAAAVVGPLPVAATDGSGSHATTGRNLDRVGSLSLCQNAQASSGDWLTRRIEQALHPDTEQLSSLEGLRGKVAIGAKTIKISCHVANSLSPTTRLAELTQRLWAVHDAGVLARHSLEAFYATLTDDQKAKFNTVVAPASESGSTAAEAANRRYRECAAQSAGATEHMFDRIEQAVRPTKAQQASLDRLRKTSAQMEKLLLASCAQPVAKSPLARLDAADQRLVVMNLAASTMEVALNDFYASLDPRQKAKFETLGR
jgi:LTXXQ motif family protein